MQELYRITKPGGICIIQTPFLHNVLTRKGNEQHIDAIVKIQQETEGDDSDLEPGHGVFHAI